MYHSITFYEFNSYGTITSTRNSYDNWHLVSKSRLLFNPPKVKTKYIDIPGADGVIDLTTSLRSTPAYENREGTFEFYVLNGYGNWASRYSEIMNFLHGKLLKAALEDDPGFYYQGRFAVDAWGSESSWSTITISYNVSPYKQNISGQNLSL